MATKSFKNISEFQNLPCQIGGMVSEEFDASTILNANERRSANRTTGFAMSAAIEAVNSASLEFSELNTDRIGVCFGSSLAGFMETVSLRNLYIKNKVIKL